ncbi:MAG: hypothetical protein WCP12_04570 [bacterium]
MLVSAKDGDGTTAVWKFLVGVGVSEANAPRFEPVLDCEQARKLNGLLSGSSLSLFE